MAKLERMPCSVSATYHGEGGPLVASEEHIAEAATLLLQAIREAAGDGKVYHLRLEMTVDMDMEPIDRIDVVDVDS